MSFWTADNKSIVVANTNGKMIERIYVTKDEMGVIQDLKLNTDAGIYLGLGWSLISKATAFSGKNAFGNPLIGSVVGTYQGGTLSRAHRRVKLLYFTIHLHYLLLKWADTGDLTRAGKLKADTDPNRSEVLVFSGGCRNSVSMYLILILCLSVIVIVLDVLVSDLPLQALSRDQAQQSHDTKPQRKYIVVDLRLGLTNQAAAAWCAVLVAEKLNRTLVLPQVRAKIPKGEIVAEENGILEDFDYVWDSEHFIHCAREKLNKPGLIFATDRQHYDVEIHQNDTFKLGPKEVPLLLDWNPALPIKHDVLGRFVGDNTTYVKVIQPISFGIANKWKYLDCFVPSERLNKMIAAYKSKLPEEYACLHARTESDWYSRACCGRQGNTTSESIDEWNCPTHPVSDTCYKTPQQIADMLKSKLDSNMTLWISSGSSREALQPLFDSWNVVTKDDLSPDLYMDYGLAEVDRMMCKDAKTFWGMGGSSFSEEIKLFFRRNGREAEYYARKNWSVSG